MKIRDVVTASNAFWVGEAVCIAGCFHYQYAQMEKYRPTVQDFAPTLTIAGTFTYLDFGKSLQGSRINGHSVFVAANFAGGNHGFGNGDHIPNGSTVTATIAQIKTRSGTVLVPGSIQSGSQQFLSRSPQEMYDSWLSGSYRLIAFNTFFNAMFLSTAIFVVCWIMMALIQYARRFACAGQQE